ncbi:MAG TPA: hypothetical protein VKY26_10420 [Actinomycetota bacterium]|nr:hypothetical protein [Actinomycetota bacterium]
MGDLRHLYKRGEFFIDDRGHGLQLSWSPEREVIVVSLWHEDRCVGTVRLPIADAPRASAFLMEALGDWLGQAHPPEQAEAETE